MPAAIIDLGSNTIKILVARRESDGRLQQLLMRTIEARISAGISREHPTLSEEGMTRGLDAVKTLLAAAAEFAPKKIQIVATSAVRDATNGREFAARILAATGHAVRILTGEEEANTIGRGLTCDPSLSDLRDFYLFDLGGGSLECLSFRDRKITQALSLPLGCVRLTEICVTEPTQPFTPNAHRRVTELTRELLIKSGFHFNLPPHAAAIGTGGTLTTARAIIAARAGRSLENTDSVLTLDQLRELLAYLSWRNLEERQRVPGMSPGRADVMPTALATVIALGERGGFTTFRNSLYNLRWGIADELLSATA